MADWEPGYTIAELGSGRYFRDQGLKYQIMTAGLTLEPITTMGGVRILPDVPLAEVKPASAGLLILPGGNTWLEPAQAPVFAVVRQFLDAGIPVAAICGATMGLAAHGLLDDRVHTSNDLGFLKQCVPTYRGEKFYVNKPAVCDSNLITAMGVAPLEFAREILNRLEVFSPETLEAWYQLNKTGDGSWFYALMGSLHRG